MKIFNARFCPEMPAWQRTREAEVTDTSRLRHRARFADSLAGISQLTRVRWSGLHFSHLEFYPNFRNSSFVTFFDLRKKPEKYQASLGRTGGICFARFRESQKRNFFL